jgi:dTDP-glucose 4,6-dehydratase
MGYRTSGRRIVVAGGAGFLGSHLCRVFLARGDEVVCVDDLSTGRTANIADLESDPAFRFVRHDVCQPVDLDGPFDAVCNLASPASPPAYLGRPFDTLTVGAYGTHNLLELARRSDARFLQASTSEIYGDPLEHPQRESYWGHVNPIGPRSVYDEAKRFGEAMTFAYERELGLDVRLVRIFNTYGPRMQPDDGRVVTNFIIQALDGTPLTVYGDGSQTRSFCYVDDEIAGIAALLDSDHRGPMNIGNPVEFTILELAELVLEVTKSRSVVDRRPLPEDDPVQRQPDITLARSILGWEPVVSLRDGLDRTVAWFRDNR